jgi:hypothetical protein
MIRPLKENNYNFFIFPFLVYFCFFLPNANAFPIGSISKVFKQIFKKSDDIIDVGKNIGKKSDDIPGLNKADNASHGADSSVHVIDSGSQAHNGNIYASSKSPRLAKVLKDHGMDVLDGATNVDDSILTVKDAAAGDSFFPYINPFWYARFIRASNYYNRPKEDERKVLSCRSGTSDFNFTLILQKDLKLPLISGHNSYDSLWKLKNLNEIEILENNRKEKITKQRLHVIEDVDSYSIFSTQKKEKQNFPQNYFIIYKDQGFDYYNFPTGSESPEIIKLYAPSGSKQNGKCFQIQKDGSYLK